MKGTATQAIKKTLFFTCRIVKKGSKLIIISFLFTVNTVNAQYSEWNINGNSNTIPINFLGTTNLQPLVFKTNGEEWMRIDPIGNVGIGTTTPTEKLEISGLLKLPPASQTQNDSPGLIFASNDDFLFAGKRLNHYGFGAYDNNGLKLYMSGFYGLNFFTGGQNRVTVDVNGNVGIGTACPNEKLTVNGKIKARYEVYVQETEGFCDYVFEETYKRPTYLEKEIWFKKNKRLYNMPSEKEIETNGLPVVTAIKSLTLNTEENSLDIVELYKIVKKLEKENEVLKQMLIRDGFEMGAGTIKNTKR